MAAKTMLLKRKNVSVLDPFFQDIANWRNQGYTFESIAAELSNRVGHEIKSSTLSNFYYRRNKAAQAQPVVQGGTPIFSVAAKAEPEKKQAAASSQSVVEEFRQLGSSHRKKAVDSSAPDWGDDSQSDNT